MGQEWRQNAELILMDFAGCVCKGTCHLREFRRRVLGQTAQNKIERWNVEVPCNFQRPLYTGVGQNVG